MKTPYRALVICLLSLLLSSCATLDKDECLNADWYLIGVEDGADGELFSRIGDHREACAKYNIIPNLPGYASGRRAGLKQYCTDSIGFSEGRDGNEYNGVCPKALEADFLAGYDDGVRLYRAEEAKNSLESELRYAQGKLRKTRDALLEKKAELIADATTAEKRASLLNDIEHLTSKKQKLRRRIQHLSDDLDDQTDHYERLQLRFGR